MSYTNLSMWTKLKVYSLASFVLMLTIAGLKYCRFSKESVSLQPGDSRQWEHNPFCRQRICTEIQHNTIKKKISDIHGRYLSKPLVWKKLLCTDLMYGLWDWAGILSVKVTGERILVFLKTFVPLVTASAVMSLKICLCDSFVILSGQRKEEPFSEIWLYHYTCQIPFSMQIKNGLLKSSSGLFSCYFLKYINPKQFKPLQTQAFSLTHKHRAKSCFKKAKATTRNQSHFNVEQSERKFCLFTYWKKKNTNPNPEKYLFNVKLKYGCTHTHTHTQIL